MAVEVPRSLLSEVLADGSCPLHLRLELERLLADESESKSGAVGSEAVAAKASALDATCQQTEDRACLSGLSRPCLSIVAGYLELDEVIAVRACSREPLQWAMQRRATEFGPQKWVFDRIRTRLWMRRIVDLTQGTKDESVFETRMKKLADEALRSRMEEEMQDALGQMEEHIRVFQAEVDRRLAEQEQQVRRMVEERVQQELDTILASEVVKVQAMVEERVRERVNAVSTVFRREVRETVRELQARLNALAEENDILRDAFAEANFRAKRMFWALRAPPQNQAVVLAGCLGPRAGALISLRRRLSVVLD